MFFFKKSPKSILEQMNYSNVRKVKDVYLYQIPGIVKDRTKEELDCTQSELELIIIGFYDYMEVIKKHKNSQIDMIFERVDVLWHNLILDTKSYMDFCSNYIGFYVHHNPFQTVKELSSREQKELTKMYLNVISKNKKYNDFRKENIDYYVRKNYDNNTGVSTNEALMLNGIMFYELASSSSGMKSSFYDTPTSTGVFGACGGSSKASSGCSGHSGGSSSCSGGSSGGSSGCGGGCGGG